MLCEPVIIEQESPDNFGQRIVRLKCKTHGVIMDLQKTIADSDLSLRERLATYWQEHTQQDDLYEQLMKRMNAPMPSLEHSLQNPTPSAPDIYLGSGVPPSNASAGMMWHNMQTGDLFVNDGHEWVQYISGSPLPDPALPIISENKESAVKRKKSKAAPNLRPPSWKRKIVI